VNTSDFSPGESGQGMKLTVEPVLVPWFRITGAVHVISPLCLHGAQRDKLTSFGVMTKSLTTNELCMDITTFI